MRNDGMFGTHEVRSQIAKFDDIRTCTRKMIFSSMFFMILLAILGSKAHHLPIRLLVFLPTGIIKL